jgi:hypothetical protein
MQIHPIENGAGETLGIAAALCGGTAAGDFRISVVTAGAGVGSADQKHPRGVGNASGSPVYRNIAILQGLPHGLKKLSPELWHFI